MASYKIALASALVAGFAFTSSASALTLNTTGLKANSVLTFTVAASGSSAAAGITFRPLGNMTRLADVSVVDPETGLNEVVESFNQPVTEAVVKVGLDLKITPLAGSAVRSGLQIIRGQKTATLANFKVSFETKKVFADIILAGETKKQIAIYDFKDNGDLKISLKGLVLNQSQSVSNLIFTTETQDILASALTLSAPLKATLATTDWGTIAVTVTSFKRSPAVSNKPLTAADVPAP
ncbi:MAG: hypothetical protein RJB60_2995 [Pseudomonadota bacterium]|jgi:hypothetical protein